MAASPDVLQVVDFLNVWGLILIGLGLILGVWVKQTAFWGIVLLSLYYMAHPPFVGMEFGVPVEGHYIIVNKTLIEIIALIIVTIFPTGTAYRFDYFIMSLIRDDDSKSPQTKKKKRGEVQKIDPDTFVKRREAMRNLALLPVFGVFFYGAYKKYHWEKVNAITGATIKVSDSTLTDLKGDLPRGRLGDLEISRMTLGCNLIGGWSHSRDLLYVSSLFKAYNTEKKIYETIELAERAGINMMNVVPNQFPHLHKYLNISGGKMQTFAQVYPSPEDMTTEIDKAIDGGTTTLYIQGGCCDNLVQNGQLDFLAKSLDYARNQGYMVGVGAHSIQVVIACEQAGIPVDYYVKTCHHDRYWSAHPAEFREEFTVDRKRFLDHNKFHDNMFDLFPNQTIEVMGKIDKPWIAFKVLAGGAIAPDDGFRYAFENGADFICVGMFDFQIVDDVNIAINVLNTLGERKRPWIV